MASGAEEMAETMGGAGDRNRGERVEGEEGDMETRWGSRDRHSVRAAGERWVMSGRERGRVASQKE